MTRPSDQVVNDSKQTFVLRGLLSY